MKRIFLGTMLFIATLAFSDFNYYDMELVHTFKKGRNPGNIRPGGFNPYNPASIYFNDEGELYLSDSKRRRIVKYDKNFNFIEEYKDMKSSVADRIVIQGKYVFASSYKTFSIESLLGERIFFLSVSKINRELKTENFTKHFEYRDGVVYLSTKRGVLYQIKNPSPIREDNILEVLEFNSEEESISRSSIDNKLKRFSDLTYFLNYTENMKRSEETESRSELKETLKLSDLEISFDKNLDYLNTDKDGNVYWCDVYRNILVFNSNYELVDAFTYNYDNCDIEPVVHPSGDVYFMDITNERAELLRIKRVW